MIWLVLFWVACGVLHHGFCFAYYQRAFPVLADDRKWEDMALSLVFSVFGPITLIAIIIHIDLGRGFKGFKLY